LEETANGGYRSGKIIKFEPPPMSHYAAITNRPLFNPSRRPATSVTAPLSAYRLQGIFASRNAYVGLVEHRSDGTVMRISEGDVIDGWVAGSVEPYAIRLSSGDRSHFLQMEGIDQNEVSDRPDQEMDDENYETDVLEDEGIASLDLDHFRRNTRGRMRLGPNPRAELAENGYRRAVPTELPPPPLLPRQNRGGRR